jgi:hypothetical protein
VQGRIAILMPCFLESAFNEKANKHIEIIAIIIDL